MKKPLILLVCCLAFSACTHEKEAQELYSKATGMKLNAQYSEAIPLYKEVISKYPRSSVISSATSDLAFCEKRVLEQKIEHNTPIILKAVDGFPARKFPATQKGTMPLGKSITALERTICNMFRKVAQQYYIYDTSSLAKEARALAKATCSGKYGEWDVSSNDNITYIISKLRTGINEKGEKVETNYAYIVDIVNNTVTAQDFSSCFVLEEDTANKILEKRVKKIDADYSRECVFPIKLEGVLK